VEEEVLAQLLRGRQVASIPEFSELPPPEVFFDPQCRNIFQVFCTLYEGAAGCVGGAPPDGRTVLAELGSDGSLIDRMAQILVETSVGSKERELPELLAELSHRYQERRLRELASEIGEAQRKGGDDALLTRLYDEKRRLSLSLHRRTRPGAGKGAG
jgi:replicative DNA helicase